jgi:glycosyltransferase involved in cell wall biosynthesis
MNISANTKISAIICFYNAEQYLREAIESVLQQEYLEWELILIDDGSFDNSTAIAMEYATNYPQKIFYYNHEGHANKGLSASRNEGIKKANGELIAFLDGDDVWLPAYFKDQISVLQNNDAAMVCEATEYWFNWNAPEVDNVVVPVGAGQDQMYTPPQLMLSLYPLGTGDAPCMCGILIKKETLIKHNGFDDSFTGMYEDQVFLTKIYLEEPVFISSKCNNRYRQRHDSMLGSSHNSGEYFTVRKKYLKWLKNYMSDSKINYPNVSDVLEKALHEPKVSVIISFFNEEDFLEETVESVIKQTYDNWELLMVDDGSSNKSTIIARNFADAYKEKIFYIEHEHHANKGVCVSRNLGVQKATGELIALLDADDAWLPNYLSTQVTIFKKNPGISMSAEGSIHWYNWNDATKKNYKIPVGTVPDQVYEPMSLILKLYPLAEGAAPGPCALVIKKSAIIQAGGFEETFKDQYQLYEDQAFLCKIYLQENVFISSACNNLYRQRPESVVKWVKAKGHYDIVRRYFLEWLKNYLNDKNIQNEKLNKLLQKALLPYHHPIIYFCTNTFPAETLRAFKRVKKSLKHRLYSSK